MKPDLPEWARLIFNDSPELTEDEKVNLKIADDRYSGYLWLQCREKEGGWYEYFVISRKLPHLSVQISTSNQDKQQKMIDYLEKRKIDRLSSDIA